MRFKRGDTFTFCFIRYNESGEVITDIPNNIIFEVKSDYNSETLIKKELNKGIIFDKEDYIYTITIDADETNSLDFGAYVYGIEINIDGVIKTIKDGLLVLEKEVVH